MSVKAKRLIAYLMFVLFIAYFGVVGAYFIFKTDPLFRLWELLTMLSAPFVLLLLVAILEDTSHNGYSVLSVAFAVCTTVATSMAHYSNVLNGTTVAEFKTEDSLAWGFFLGLSFIFAALTVDKADRSKKRIKGLLLIIGIMCLIGLMGPILHIYALWFVAVAGYGPGALVLTVEWLREISISQSR